MIITMVISIMIISIKFSINYTFLKLKYIFFINNNNSAKCINISKIFYYIFLKIKYIFALIIIIIIIISACANIY